MGSVVTALLFICCILSFIVANPKVGDIIRGMEIVEQQELVVDNDDEVRERMMLVLTAILDRLEQKENSTEEKPIIDVDLAKRLIEQDALESFVNYRGNDPVVRERLGLPPKIVVDNVTIAAFEQEFATRFGDKNVR